jgi:hypothetical protein
VGFSIGSVAGIPWRFAAGLSTRRRAIVRVQVHARIRELRDADSFRLVENLLKTCGYPVQSLRISGADAVSGIDDPSGSHVRRNPRQREHGDTSG